MVGIAPDSSTLTAALRLLRRGAAPIAVGYRSKQPVGAEWQKQRPTAETVAQAFNGTPVNIGVLWGSPSNGLVDVDLDWPEACAIAPSLLPRTAVYGRAGNPGSHFIYRVEAAATRQWTVPAALVPSGRKDVVLELRAEGTQSVVPPSMHPTGELYSWEHERKPAVVAHADLQRRLNLIASGAVLVPIWRPGIRHPLALALSGAMLSAGYSVDEARDLIVAVAGAAGDDEITDRKLAVKSSKQAIEAGTPATGIPKLAELLGEAAVGTLKKWLGLGSALPGAWLMDAAPLAPGADDGVLAVANASSIKEEPIRWLWPNRIARGKLNIVAGEPGLSKSVLSCAITGIVTRGGTWPLDGTRCEAGNALILNVEDDPADTIVPRLRAADADLDRVQIIEGVRSADGKVRQMTLADVAQLEAHLAQYPTRYALLVCDPIGALMAKRDTHRDADVRTLLAPLALLAMKYDLAVLLIGHLNKGAGMAALHRVIGSIAFVAAARMVYFLAADPDDDSRLLLVPGKTNIAPMGMAGLSYTLESADLGNGIVAPRIRWHDVPEMRTAAELLSPPLATPEHDAVEEWLREELAAGPVAVRDLRTRADLAVDVSWRTVERVARSLSVIGTGEKSNRTWALPAAASDQVPAHEPEQNDKTTNRQTDSSGDLSLSTQSDVSASKTTSSPTLSDVVMSFSADSVGMQNAKPTKRHGDNAGELSLSAAAVQSAPPIEGSAVSPAALHPCTDCNRLANGVFCTHYRAVMPEPSRPNACVRFVAKEPLTPWS